MDVTEEKFPPEIVAFSKELAALLIKHDMSRFHGEYRTGFKHPAGSYDTFKFSWDEGRHGAEAGRINILAEASAYLTIKLAAP